MRQLLLAGVTLAALGGIARAGVLHDATACGGITYCNADVTDASGRPDGTIGFSAKFANGGQFADTSFAGSFYRTDASGAANYYDDFAGVFVEVSNPPGYGSGVTFTLQGTFNNGTNSFTRTIHVFCRAGRGDACTVTDLRGETVIRRPAPLQGVNALLPAPSLDEMIGRD